MLLTGIIRGLIRRGLLQAPPAGRAASRPLDRAEVGGVGFDEQGIQALAGSTCQSGSAWPPRERSIPPPIGLAGSEPRSDLEPAVVDVVVDAEDAAADDCRAVRRLRGLCMFQIRSSIPSGGVSPAGRNRQQRSLRRALGVGGDQQSVRPREITKGMKIWRALDFRWQRAAGPGAKQRPWANRFLALLGDGPSGIRRQAFPPFYQPARRCSSRAASSPICGKQEPCSTGRAVWRSSPAGSLAAPLPVHPGARSMPGRPLGASVPIVSSRAALPAGRERNHSAGPWTFPVRVQLLISFRGSPARSCGDSEALSAACPVISSTRMRLARSGVAGERRLAHLAGEDANLLDLGFGSWTINWRVRERPDGRARLVLVATRRTAV